MAILEAPKGWYSRHYLPHCDEPGRIQAITFRLADSLPASLREHWRQASTQEPLSRRRARLQALLDSGRGSCALRDARVAQLVEEALLHYDGQAYRLLAWVIMPNHVHVVIETLPGHELNRVVRRWKTFTARRANRILGRSGSFWQTDYYDRFVRDEDHLAQAVAYVHANPVRAGLVERPENWPFGSARHLPALTATLHAPWPRDA